MANGGGGENFSNAEGGSSHKWASNSAEGEISKCQELDGKSLSKRRSQSWGEQHHVMLLGGKHRSSSEE